jgi:hypoxanthine phosphoribosyltransferase
MWPLVERLLAIIGALASIVAVGATAVQWYRVRQWKRILTWDDALRAATTLLERVEGSPWKPEIVIGIGRSGGIWGGWLAGNLGLPFAVVDDRYESGPEGRRVEFPGGQDVLVSLRKLHGDSIRPLVVDGATSTGQTPSEFRRRFAEQLKGWDVRFAVLYRNPTSAASIDFVGVEGPEPWPDKFPWHFRKAYRPHLRDLLGLDHAA